WDGVQWRPYTELTAFIAILLGIFVAAAVASLIPVVVWVVQASDAVVHSHATLSAVTNMTWGGGSFLGVAIVIALLGLLPIYLTYLILRPILFDNPPRSISFENLAGTPMDLLNARPHR